MPRQTLFTDHVFKIEVPGLIGMFRECRGLELWFEVYEYAEGGNNDFVHKLPGRVQYPNLVLTSGLTDQVALFDWFWKTHDQAEGKEIKLTLEAGARSRSWTFENAFPVHWSGPQFVAGGNSVATETLEIAHSGLKPA